VPLGLTTGGMVHLVPPESHVRHGPLNGSGGAPSSASTMAG
jgi:hypothetical protein